MSPLSKEVRVKLSSCAVGRCKGSGDVTPQIFNLDPRKF
jgi:hypothetical protein